MRSGSALATFGAAVLLAAGAPALAGRLVTPLELRSAASFVVLGHSSVANTGSTRVTGNVGVSPGTTVNGFSDGMFTVGDIYRNDALARQARDDSDRVANELARLECDKTLPEPQFGNRTFLPGVYCFSAAVVQLNGTIVLDAGHKPDALWIFRFEGSLVTSENAAVLVARDGYDGNVFWHTRGPVTVGPETRFVGNIFSGGGIAFQEGAQLSGRAIARGGAVTADRNRLSLCCAPISVAPASVPDGMIGVPYHQTFTASGGVPPYTFTHSTGELPPGLVLTPDGTLSGTLSGTPVQAGTFAFTITATDSLGCTGTGVYAVKVNPDVAPCPITFEESLPLPGTACVYYEHTFKAEGGTGSYLFTATGRPPELELSRAGVLSGTVPAAVSYDLLVTVADGAHACTRPFRVSFGCPPARGDPLVLPPAMLDADYPSQQLSPFTCSESRTYLPITEPFRVSETGLVSGRPSRAGTYTFDVSSRTPDGCVVTRAVTIVVECPDITLSELPPMVQGVPYVETIGGIDPQGVTVTTTKLPDGVQHLGLQIFGKPTKTGPYEFTVTVERAGCTVSRAYDLDCGALTIAPRVLHAGAVGVPYPPVGFRATGGTAPYTFSLSSGPLPPGFDPFDGTLSGTPTVAGTFAFRIRVVDRYGCSSMRAYVIEICPVPCPAEIPTLPAWGLLLFSVVLASAGVLALRRL
jgi:hypothetical protein